MLILAPAKLNLTLDVVGVRPDGYHLLRSVMQSVDLCDRITFERIPSGFCFDCEAGPSAAPADGSNLAVRAARAFCERVGNPLDGLSLRLEKAIPSGAGMGGGSADAAAVLTGLNALCGAGLPLTELCALGERLGADVPFCLTGGTALVEGIGERITPLPPLPDCRIVVATPGFSINTGEAFARLDRGAIRSRPRTEELLSALAQGVLAPAARSLGNVFEQTVSDSRLDAVRDELRARGALGAAMTGSGSAVFGIFEGSREAAVCCEALEKRGFWARCCRPMRGGPQIFSSGLE